MFRRGNLNIVIAVLLGVVLLMGAGLVYLSNQGSPARTQSEPDTAVNPQESTQSATVAPTPIAFVVEYTGENSLTTEQKTQITNRVITPARDFYTDLGGDYRITKISIEALSDTEYYATFKHENKSEEGYLLPRSDDGFGWWIPPCVTSCVFSKEFAQKYPLIVDPVQ